jgi:AcrR family transcriptional regulator
VAAGLRERKKQAVKTALEQTALRLFMEKGYENTTVEEISEAVDVSTRTFFRYFATKDEVLFAHQPERLAAIRAFFSARPADAPLADTVRAVVEFFAEDLEANADLLVVQATVYAEARLPAGIIRLRQDELIEAIAVGLAPALGRSAGIRPVVIATATMCAIELAARAWFRGGRQGDLRAMVRNSYGDLIQTLAI